MTKTSLIEFENRFENCLQAITDSPWPVLQLIILEDLLKQLQAHLSPSQRASYLQELRAGFQKVLGTILTMPLSDLALDPRRLEFLLNSLHNQGDPAMLLDRDMVSSTHARISALYLRLGDIRRCRDVLASGGFLPLDDRLTNADQVLDKGIAVPQIRQQFLGTILELLPPEIGTILEAEVRSAGMETFGGCCRGLFTVHYEGWSTGILATIALSRLELSNRLATCQVRIATHLVDEWDVLADQTRDVCAWLRTRFIRENGNLRLEYSIDRPASLLVGNSIGLVLALLGGHGLYLYRHNRAVEPVIYRDAVFTGALDSSGIVRPVSAEGIPGKVTAAFFGKVRVLVLPQENLAGAEKTLAHLQADFPHRTLQLLPLDHVQELDDHPEVIHRQRRRVLDRAGQLLKEYANTVTLLIIGFILILIAGFYFGIVRYPVPASTRFSKDRHRTIVKNRFGFTLWKTGIDAGSSSIYDLDRDGSPEVIVGYHNYSDTELSGKLVCYDSRGNIRWSMPSGYDVQFGNNIYSDYFGVGSMLIDDFDGDGLAEVVATAEGGFFPCRIFAVDYRGGLISEYWHAGNVHLVITTDIYKANSGKEIVVTGRNNEYRKGILILLDPLNMQGASPQMNPYYIQPESPPGNEIYYLMFPHTHYWKHPMTEVTNIMSVNENTGIRLLNEYKVDIPGEGNISLCIVYELDKTFKARLVDVCDSYYLYFNIIFPDRDKLAYNDPATIKPFRQIEYWNGQRWVAQPSRNSHYLPPVNETE